MPTDDTLDLFAPDPKPRGRSRAPDELTPAQTKALYAWAEERVPWVTRGAFDSFTPLDAYVEEILEWWQANGGLKMDWLKTIQNRIRQTERRRLERMARSGDSDASLALRAPKEWALRFDRGQRAEARVGSTPGSSSQIRPAGGRVLTFRK